MNNDIITSPRWIQAYAWQLCEAALPHMGEAGKMEVWAGKYGNVIVDNSGNAWIGDLCYMREKFGWSHSDYMQAYGYAIHDPEWRNLPNATSALKVHQFGDKFILVIATGADGDGPLGLGLDTAAVSFVSTERSKVEAAAAACLEFLESKRAHIIATEAEDVIRREAHQKRMAEKAAAAAKFRSPGNTVIGHRSVAVYAGGGYRGRPKFKSEDQRVHFVIAKATPDFLVSTAGERFKIDSLKDCQAFTPRQIAARKREAAKRQIAIA